MSTDQYSERDVLVDLREIDKRLRPASQMRKRMDREQVEKYAENLPELPPVLLIYDSSEGKHWLVDGCYRTHAARSRDDVTIKARVKLGSYEEAFREASRANAKHGVPYRESDKRKRVEEALKMFPEGTKKQAEIADLCGVAVSYVNAILRDTAFHSEKLGDTPPKVKGADGKMYPTRYNTRRTGGETSDPESSPAPATLGAESELADNGHPALVPSSVGESSQPAPDQPEAQELFTLSDSPEEHGEGEDWDHRWSEIELLIQDTFETCPEELRPMFAADLYHLAFHLRNRYCPQVETRVEHIVTEEIH